MVKDATLSPRDRREQEKLATRQKILDAARELCAEQGVEATTMRGIADRIGYTATAIYYHFKDKDEVIRELCHSDFLQLGHAMAKAAHINDPIERIRITGLAYVDFGLKNPSQYKFMFMTRHDHDVIHPDTIPIDRTNPEESAYAFLQQCVADAINQDRIRPELCDNPNHIANMLWAAVHGVVALHISKSNDPWVDWGDPRQLAEKMVDSVVRGITV